MRRSIARGVLSAVLLDGHDSPGRPCFSEATLDGRTISIDAAADLDCHDFEYPVIRCFTSIAALEFDVAVQLGRQRSRTSFAPASIGYVVVYEHVAYGGAVKVLALDVPWLSSLGWNDKISSFKSFGASGAFHEHSPNGGFVYSYGPSSRVASLSGMYNDKFSSFFII